MYHQLRRQNREVNISLLTSSSKIASTVVGFDHKNHQQALLLHNTDTPVQVLTANEKSDNLFVNNHSTIVKILVIVTLKAHNHQLACQATQACHMVMLFKSDSVRLTHKPEIGE